MITDAIRKATDHYGLPRIVSGTNPASSPWMCDLGIRNSKWCLVNSLTIIEYSSDRQMLWSDCAYAQAGLSLCWSHIPNCWKSHTTAHLLFDYILNVPVNNFSVISGRVFLAWTSTNHGLLCLAQGHKAVMPVRLKPDSSFSLQYRQRRTCASSKKHSPLLADAKYGNQIRAIWQI